jgi:putative spermidine/putrescine transport system permease protein
MKGFTSAVGWLFLVTLLLPVIQTVWVSFSPDSFLMPPTRDWSLKWYQAFLEDPRWTTALGRSLGIGIVSAILSVLVAAPAAYASTQPKFRGRTLLLLAVLLPGCLPPAALGMGLLPLFHFTGLWGSSVGIVLVHCTMSLPVVFLILRSQWSEQLHNLETAAHGLGASFQQTTLRVTLPLLRPAIVTAGIAGFVLSLNETVLAIFLCTPATETLPAMIWPQLRFAPTPIVAVASCATAILGTVGILVIRRR